MFPRLPLLFLFSRFSPCLITLRDCVFDAPPNFHAKGTPCDEDSAAQSSAREREERSNGPGRICGASYETRDRSKLKAFGGGVWGDGGGGGDACEGKEEVQSMWACCSSLLSHDRTVMPPAPNVADADGNCTSSLTGLPSRAALNNGVGLMRSMCSRRSNE